MNKSFITIQPFLINEKEELNKKTIEFTQSLSCFDLPRLEMDVLIDGKTDILHLGNKEINIDDESWLTVNTIGVFLFCVFIQESFPDHVSIVFNDMENEFTWKNLSSLLEDNNDKAFIDAVILMLKTNNRNCITLNEDLESNTIKSFYF